IPAAPTRPETTFPPRLVFRTWRIGSGAGGYWSGAVVAIRAVRPRRAAWSSGRRNRHDRAAPVDQTLGGLTRDPRVSGAAAAQRARGRAGAGAPGGAADERGSGRGVGGQSPDGAAATV